MLRFLAEYCPIFSDLTRIVLSLLELIIHTFRDSSRTVWQIIQPFLPQKLRILNKLQNSASPTPSMGNWRNLLIHYRTVPHYITWYHLLTIVILGWNLRTKLDLLSIIYLRRTCKSRKNWRFPNGENVNIRFYFIRKD